MYEQNLLPHSYSLSNSIRDFKYDQYSVLHDILNYFARHEHMVATLLVDSRDIVQWIADDYNPGYKSDVEWKTA